MTTQYTTILKLALPVQGELSGTWGDVVNNNITSMVEEAVAGRKVINTWTANSHTLTSADGTTSEARAAILTLTDTGTALSGAGSVVCPAASKIYIVENGTAQVITVKTASGTGIAVPVGKNMVVFCDGTNVEEGISNIASLSIGGDGATVTGIKDEDNMASNSATKLATQQSIKAYVDSQVTVQDLDVTDGSASIDIDLDSESLGILGGTGIDSTASGTAVTLAVDATVATLTGSQTLTNKTLTSPDINAPDIDGGAIDDAVIGGATPAAGSFTTIAASGNVDFNADVDVDGTLETDALTINGVASVPFEAADHSKLDGIEASADVTDATNVTAAGALMDSEVTNLAQVKAFDSSDYATAAQGTTADAALPRTGGAMTGAITTNSTFDGRDVATDGTKLDGIEASADVTDATNVTAAGALMDSELTSIASVKALNQGVATTDSPTFAGITTTANSTIGTDKKIIFRDSAIHISSTADGDLSIAADDEIDLTSTLIDINGNLDVSGTANFVNLTLSGGQGSDGQVLTSTGSGVQWENASGGIADVAADTSPQLGGNLDVNGHDIISASNGAIELDPNGSGKVIFKGNATRGAGQFVLNCENNSHGITIKGPPHSASASYTLTLPDNDGDNNQLLKTDGSGNLSWVTVSSGVDGITSSTTTTTIKIEKNSNLTQVGIGEGVTPEATLEVYSSGTSTSKKAFMVNTQGAANSILVRGDGKVGVFRSNTSEIFYNFDIYGDTRIDGDLNVKNIKIGYDNTSSNNAQGTDGQVLTSTGSGIAWEDPGAPSTPGINNVRLGTNAGANFNNYAERNVAIGVEAAQDFITDGQTQADENVALGYRAMGDGRSPNGNAAVGAYALETVRYDGSSMSFGSSSSTGAFNIAIGYKAAQSSIKLNSCIAIGYEAAKVLGSTSSYAAVDVLAIGNRALYSNTGQPSELCVIGNDAMYNYTYSNPAYTCAVGRRAGYDVTTGFANTFFGNSSGDNVTTGDYNTIIGWRSKGTADVQKATVLGGEVTASGSETFTFGYSSNDSAIANGATTITAPSDERYKEDITDSTAGLSFIKDLRPVTFRWKKEKDIPSTQNAYVKDSETRVMNDRTNHGFIAQEVKAVIDSHSEIKDGFDMWTEDDADGRQRLGPSALIPILVKAIQELEARVNELEGD